jgi:hypothetical protein
MNLEILQIAGINDIFSFSNQSNLLWDSRFNGNKTT